MDVLFQPTSPEKAKINGFFSLWGLAIILGAMGAAFFLVGFSIVAVGMLKKRKVAGLRENGVKVTANFQRVERNTSLEINGKHPFQIISQWKNPMTSKLHVFTSENIQFDPTDHIDRDEISVLIEKGNPKRYHVDLSFLPTLAD